MAQNGQRHGADVFNVGAVLARKGGVALGCHDEELRGAWSGTSAEVLVDLIGRVLSSWARFGGQLDGVFDHVVRYRHLQNVLQEGGDFVG